MRTKLQDGVKIIDEAEWLKDDTNTLNLYVTDRNSNRVHCYMQLRPEYCDRGHIQLNIDGGLGLDGADRFPRYFFSFEEADTHVRLFLKWRLFGHREKPHLLPFHSLKRIENPLTYSPHTPDKGFASKNYDLLEKTLRG